MNLGAAITLIVLVVVALVVANALSRGRLGGPAARGRTRVVEREVVEPPAPRVVEREVPREQPRVVEREVRREEPRVVEREVVEDDDPRAF